MPAFSANGYTINATVSAQNSGVSLTAATPSGQQIAISASSSGLSMDSVKTVLFTIDKNSATGLASTSVNNGSYPGTNVAAKNDSAVNQTTSTPEQTSGRTTKTAKILSFPRNRSEKYFIAFEFKSTSRKFITEPTLKREEAIIYLPMPSSLAERFSVSYATRSLGTLYGAVGPETGIAGTLASIFTGSGTAEADITKSAESIKNLTSSSANKGVLARSLITSMNTTAGSLYDKITGTVLNPYTSLFFEGPDLRNHSFTFRLSPNNREESVIIKEIIDQFKFRMLPEQQSLVMLYPDICSITLAAGTQNEKVYEIYDSYLKNMTVNYAPQGSPSFFADGAPAEVELTLEFGEINMVTRNVIDNVPSTAREGGPSVTSTQGQWGREDRR